MKQPTPKEKAKELVEKFKDYVHGYVGSSMLTNTEYSEVILRNAKLAAGVCVDEILRLQDKIIKDNGTGEGDYWNDVKKEIESMS